MAEGRTAAVLATTGMGLAILVEVERGPEGRRVRPWVWGMVALFAALPIAGMQIAWLRDWFEIVRPGGDVWALVAGGLAAGIAALLAVRRLPWLARIEGSSG